MSALTAMSNLHKLCITGQSSNELYMLAH